MEVGFHRMSGVFDAPYRPLFSPSFVLAENDIGYGFLTDAYYTSDIDVYSLGLLAPGNYSVDVDSYTWDFGEFGFGSVGSFEVLDSRVQQFLQVFQLMMI